MSIHLLGRCSNIRHSSPHGLSSIFMNHTTLSRFFVKIFLIMCLQWCTLMSELSSQDFFLCVCVHLLAQQGRRHTLDRCYTLNSHFWSIPLSTRSTPFCTFHHCSISCRLFNPQRQDPIVRALLQEEKEHLVVKSQDIRPEADDPNLRADVRQPMIPSLEILKEEKWESQSWNLPLCSR